MSVTTRCVWACQSEIKPSYKPVWDQTHTHTTTIWLLLSYHTRWEAPKRKGRERSEQGMEGGIVTLTSINHLIKILIIMLNRKSWTHTTVQLWAEFVNVGVERHEPFHLQLPETPIMYSVGDSLPPSLPLSFPHSLNHSLTPSLSCSLPPSLTHACHLNKTALMPLSKLCKKKAAPPTCGPTLPFGSPLSLLLTVLNHFCMTWTYKMLLEDIRKDGRGCQKQQRWVKWEHCSEECTPKSVRAPGAEGKTCLYAASLQKYLHKLRMKSDRRQTRSANQLKVIMRCKRCDIVIGDITIARYGNSLLGVFSRVGVLVTVAETTLADEIIMFIITYKQPKSCIKLNKVHRLFALFSHVGRVANPH